MMEMSSHLPTATMETARRERTVVADLLRVALRPTNETLPTEMTDVLVDGLRTDANGNETGMS